MWIIPNHERRTIFAIILVILAITGVFAYMGMVDGLFSAFYKITKNRPLFYDPTLDTNELENAINALQKTEDEFLATNFSFMDAAEKALYPEEWRLFPDAFLYTLLEINIMTMSFLNEPTWMKAFSLVQKYREAANAYNKAVILHLQLLENYKSKHPDALPVPIDYLLGSATSLGVIESDLKLVKKNAEALRKEANSRLLCMLTGFCGEFTQKKRNNDFKGEDSAKSTPELLNPDIAAVRKNYVEVSGPFRIVSGCWGQKNDGTPKNQFFYLYRYNRGSNVYLKPKLATENYYLDYEKTLGSVPTARLYLENGLRFHLQPETNNYRCADNTFGPKLIALDYLKKDIKKRGVIKIDEISEAEIKFTESEITEEKHFHALQNLYRQIYLDSKDMDNVSKKILWERMLLTQSKLYGLPYLLKNAASSLEFTDLENRFSKKFSKVNYLFPAHINYSLFFMPFSESVWLINKNPSYLLKVSRPLDNRFTTYTKLKSEGYTDKEIKSLTGSFKKILEEFLIQPDSQ